MNHLPHIDEWVVFVSFNTDGTPYQVFTQTPGGRSLMYDIDYSRQAGSYVLTCEQGGHPHLQWVGMTYWASSDVNLSRVRVYKRDGKTTGKPPFKSRRVGDDYRVPIPRRAKKHTFPITELADRVEVPDEVVYCFTCNDYLTPEHDNYPCPHCSWCKACGMWSTPQERCRCDKREKAKNHA